MGRGRVTAALVVLASLIAAALPLSLVVAGAAPAGAAPAPIKIMPLGDSITYGSHDGNASPGGYRISLEDKLVAGGYSFDLVGTQTSGPASLADKNHEGHGGFTIARIRSEIFTYLAEDPRVVLLMIGTNDIGTEGGDPGITSSIPDSRLDEFVGQVRQLVNTILDNTNATVILAKPTPWKVADRPKNHPHESCAKWPNDVCVSDIFAQKRDATLRYGNKLASLAGARVSIVDMFSNFLYAKNSPTWLADENHPNLTGYDQMANRWYPTLKTVLDSLGTPTVTPPGAPTIGTATAGNGQATVTFTPPTNNGGAPITSYRVESEPGGLSATGSGSPLTVTGLANGTSYRFKVRATNSAGAGEFSALSNAVTPTGPPAGGDTYLSNLNATSVSGTFQKDKNAAGGTLRLNGQSYTKGLGVNAISNVTYALNGQYKNFITDVGIDDSCTGTNKSNIQIVADGRIIYPTGGPQIFTPSSATLPLNLDVTGKNTLTLTASGAGDGTTCDRIDWAGARLTTSPSSATAPDAPTNASATAGNQSATVSWTPPASDGGAPITAYVVYRGDTTDTPVTFVGSGVTTAAVPNLANGTSYQFTVRAQNAIGLSSASNLTAAVTPHTTAPGAPTNVQATPGDTTATVTFTPPSNDGGALITEYRVYDGSTQLQTDAGDTTSPITVAGLTNETTYNLVVKAVNSVGEGLGSSPAVAVTPHPTPVATAPGPPRNVGATPGNAIATVTFQPPLSDGGALITEYRVYDGSTQLQTDAGDTTSPITVTGLVNSTTYNLVVKAVNSVGEGQGSSPAVAVTPTAPPTGAESFLGDLTPTSASSARYWRNIGTGNPGKKLKILTKEYEKGVQVDPGNVGTFNLTYNLSGTFSRFQSDIGIDANVCGAGGNARFKVFKNGDLTTPIYDSGTTAVTGATNPTKKVDVSLAGVTSLTLRVEKLGGAGCNYSDWADAKLVP